MSGGGQWYGRQNQTGWTPADPRIQSGWMHRPQQYQGRLNEYNAGYNDMELAYNQTFPTYVPAYKPNWNPPPYIENDYRRRPNYRDPQQRFNRRCRMPNPFYKQEGSAPNNRRRRTSTPFSQGEGSAPNNRRRRTSTPFSQGEMHIERRCKTPVPYMQVIDLKLNAHNDRQCKTPVPHKSEGAMQSWKRKRSANTDSFNDDELSKPSTSGINKLQNEKAEHKTETAMEGRLEANNKKRKLIWDYSDDENGRKTSDSTDDKKKQEIKKDELSSCGGYKLETRIVFFCRYCNTISLDKETSLKHVTTNYHQAKYKAHLMEAALGKGK